jgi:uncharacterized protein (DUF1330 family)
MPAYMIVTAQLKDRQAFVEGYGKVAAALVAQFGGRYVVRAPGAACLEGPWGEGSSVVISEWPDRAAAEAFWNSAEYQAAKKLREGIAECQVLLIEAPGLA